jgi:uncharacterized membrane protein YbhN (UPF0104 family)
LISLSNNRLLNISIKLIVGLLLLWILYLEIFTKEDINQIWTTFLDRWRTRPIGWLLAVLLLMPVNWIIENFKWRVLLKEIEPLTFWQSQSAIFAGVTFSIFTPNRIGEYGGRILFVKAIHNWKAVIATLVGSYSQLLVILSFGILGFGLYMADYFAVEKTVLQSVLFLSIVLVVVLLFCFYNIPLLIPLVHKLPFANRLRGLTRNVGVLESYDNATLSRALGYAVLRYLIYTLQYYLILRYFAIDIKILEGLAGIATIYLFQTSIPLPPLMGLIARGNLAILIWGNFSDDQLGILAATFILWIINLILPAIIGSLVVSKVNIVRSLGIGSQSSKEKEH